MGKGRHIRGAALTVVSRRVMGQKLGAGYQILVFVRKGSVALKPLKLKPGVAECCSTSKCLQLTLG